MDRRHDRAMGAVLAAVLATGLVAGCAGVPRGAAGPFSVAGETRFLGRPLATGEAQAMRAEPGGRIYRTGIAADGTFRFELPPGSYFMMARSTAGDTGKELFAFWANNPLQLFGDISEPVTLPFVVAPGPPQLSDKPGITGRVIHDGRPVTGAVVAAFLDASGEFHGPPYAFSEPTAASGRFVLDLPPGRYFLLARKKSDGGYLGPLLRDDLSGFFPANPVVLRAGEGLTLDLPMVRVNRPRGAGSLAPGESMVIEGKVTTETGRPAAGIRVVLYDIPEMLGRPVFISSPTDGEGRYRLEVSRTGRFYAAARSVIGHPPETGELTGLYNGTEDHSLVLEWGQRLEGIDIVVREQW